MVVIVAKIATAVQIVVTAAVWGATAAFVQVEGIANQPSTSTALLGVLATAISGQTALIGWSYRRLFSGDLVKVDISKLHEQALKREDGYRQMVEQATRREESAWQQLTSRKDS